MNVIIRLDYVLFYVKVIYFSFGPCSPRYCSVSCVNDLLLVTSQQLNLILTRYHFMIFETSF